MKKSTGREEGQTQPESLLLATLLGHVGLCTTPLQLQVPTLAPGATYALGLPDHPLPRRRAGFGSALQRDRAPSEQTWRQPKT